MVDSNVKTLKPDTESQFYTYNLPDWLKMNDAHNGERTIKARASGSDYPGTAYLPKLSSHFDDAVDQPGRQSGIEKYGKYRDRAQFFNATRRTIEGLSGLVMRKDPILEGVAAIEDDFEDITKSGDPIEDFSEEVLVEKLKKNYCGILVDMPRMGYDGISVAEAEKMNIRPSWTLFRAEEIINCHWQWINNELVLDNVRLRESRTEQDPDNEFAMISIPRIRELALKDTELPEFNNEMRTVYIQRIYEIVEKDWQVVEEIIPLMNNSVMDFIPFEVVAPKKKGNRVDPSPLLDLVNINMAWYRKSADLENAVHICGVPTPWAAGFQPEQDGTFKFGTDTVWTTNQVGAQVGFLEFSGGGITSIERAMDRDEANMAKIGSRVLAPERRQVEAAETATIRQSGETSILGKIVRQVSRSLTRCARWHLMWVSGVEVNTDDVRIELNNDFDPIDLNPQKIQAILQLYLESAISFEEMFHLLKKGEIIRSETDIDQMVADIEADSLSSNNKLGGSFPLALAEITGNQEGESEKEPEEESAP